MLDTSNKSAFAYIIGVALGDGNLSNPNGRAVRLRITCDLKYPNIALEIQEKLHTVAPNNKISISQKKGCIDISCYSNEWEKSLGWKVGSKLKQDISVPTWVQENPDYSKACLKGLLQTDGSIYTDRGYLMVNFVSCSRLLAFDVLGMIESLGFQARMSTVSQKSTTKYTVRVARQTKDFIETICLYKN